MRLHLLSFPSIATDSYVMRPPHGTSRRLLLYILLQLTVTHVHFWTKSWEAINKWLWLNDFIQFSRDLWVSEGQLMLFLSLLFSRDPFKPPKYSLILSRQWWKYCCRSLRPVNKGGITLGRFCSWRLRLAISMSKIKTIFRRKSHRKNVSENCLKYRKSTAKSSRVILPLRHFSSVAFSSHNYGVFIALLKVRLSPSMKLKQFASEMPEKTCLRIVSDTYRKK